MTRGGRRGAAFVADARCTTRANLPQRNPDEPPTRASLYAATFADAATIGDYRTFKEIRCLRPEQDLA